MKLKTIISLTISLLLLGFAFWFFYLQIKEVSFDEITQALKTKTFLSLGLSLFFCGFSYFLLTGFDWLSLRYVKAKLPYWKIAIVSFIGFSFSHNMGHPLMTGGYCRFRLYGNWGLKPLEVLRVILFCSMNFWMGVLLVGGVALSLGWVAVPTFLNEWFGAEFPWGPIFLALLFMCACLCSFYRKKIEWRNINLCLPGKSLFLGQLVIASLEWFFASLAFYLLLPSSEVFHLGEMVGIYLFSILIGFVSQVPGGMGVFESAMILYLKKYFPIAEITATLLIFRVFYFWIPFVLSIGLYTHFGVLLPNKFSNVPRSEKPKP